MDALVGEEFAVVGDRRLADEDGEGLHVRLEDGELLPDSVQDFPLGIADFEQSFSFFGPVPGGFGIVRRCVGVDGRGADMWEIGVVHGISLINVSMIWISSGVKS